MTETVGIIIIFFVIIVFGLIFYSNYQKTALTRQREELLEKDAIALSLKATYLQEIRCEQTGPPEEETGTCVDLYKLNALKEIASDELYYSNLLGTADIYFIDLINNKTYPVYNGSISDFTKMTRVRTPILLRNVTVLDSTGKFTETEDYFGVLYVDYYS